jgi:hypothetical protein
MPNSGYAAFPKRFICTLQYRERIRLAERRAFTKKSENFHKEGLTHP